MNMLVYATSSFSRCCFTIIVKQYLENEDEISSLDLHLRLPTMFKQPASEAKVSMADTCIVRFCVWSDSLSG